MEQVVFFSRILMKPADQNSFARLNPRNSDLRELFSKQVKTFRKMVKKEKKTDFFEGNIFLKQIMGAAVEAGEFPQPAISIESIEFFEGLNFLCRKVWA